MQTPQTSQHSWPPRWPLAIDRHASMPACHNRNAGMLGCTQAAQTDQHFLAPSLAGWSSTSTPGGGQEFWCVCTAGMHPSIPAPQLLACWHAGMLVDGQPAREGGKNAGLSVLLGCTPACQHPQLLACWHAGMLVDGQPRGRGRKMLSVLLACTPACQHPQLLACWHAGMQTSSTDRPA